MTAKGFMCMGNPDSWEDEHLYLSQPPKEDSRIKEPILSKRDLMLLRIEGEDPRNKYRYKI